MVDKASVGLYRYELDVFTLGDKRSVAADMVDPGPMAKTVLLTDSFNTALGSLQDIFSGAPQTACQCWCPLKHAALAHSDTLKCVPMYPP